MSQSAVSPGSGTLLASERAPHFSAQGERCAVLVPSALATRQNQWASQNTPWRQAPDREISLTNQLLL
jgi:hypothetical protein